MKAFENLAVSYIAAPTCREVLERLRRDERCKGNPLSCYCDFVVGRDAYLLHDVDACEVCTLCDRFDQAEHGMMGEWEDWVLRMEEAYT